jgi:pimeloyl-ACP methyl ester carboxylesterase
MARKVSVGRVVVTGLLVVTGLYLVCVLGLTLFQRRLLYFPCRTPFARLSETAEVNRFKPWLSPQGGFIGWVRLTTSGAANRQILLLHGNAGCAPDWFHYAEQFQTLEPCDFYILEYPGFGGRKGPPTQTNLLGAAEEAFKTLPDKCKVFLVGESLGTGVTAWLAGAHDRQIGGIFLVAPYNNLTAVARRHLPLFPVSLILKDKYPASQWLTNYHGPVAVLLAGRDQVVPTEFGQALYDSYGGPKKLWMEPGAGHNDVHQPGRNVYPEVLAFWNGSTR